MGVSTNRGRRWRRPLRPSDRAYLESRCDRCRGSKIGVEAPTDSRTNLCAWCERMLYKLERD